ncbi:beta-ketoacyl-ACP synthase III [Serratia nematodiphila]|uniref:beta-ketoacyl-ACP synthase III n=1 Tax=Serratia nematodiphila TaxID=458197 RepID=UPI0011D4CD82|nr:beta-ketoacyl-ACP synthase III [Serratia nematodiphila]TXE57043.1 ketoacyl-ACP synthase III [Serratia nematodiphila]
MQTVYSRIIGTGMALPGKVLTNDDIAKITNTSNEWIKSRTGICQRHVVVDEKSSDLATLASQRAMERAHVSAKDIDLIITATTTPDLVFPSTSCIVQNNIGANGCPAFDINAACSGFIYSLSIADAFIRSNQATKVLVIGVDTLSKVVNWNDRETSVLFGDGAGAFVLDSSNEPGIYETYMSADGNYKDHLYCPVGVSSGFYDKENYGLCIRMAGSEVFKVAVRNLTNASLQAINKSGLSASSIDWFIPHQANIRIIEATAKLMNIEMDKVIVTINKHGNTSAASIPLAFSSAVDEGIIKKGQNVLLSSFGSGFTWGSAMINY